MKDSFSSDMWRGFGWMFRWLAIRAVFFLFGLALGYLLQHLQVTFLWR